MMPLGASLQTYRWKRLAWPYPEWWSLALCVVAWLMFLAYPMAVGPHMSHGNHAKGTTVLPYSQAVWTAEAFWWLVMSVAMMVPLVLDPIRTTAARSLWRRRHRAISGFLTGYLVLWMLFGIVASMAISELQSQIQLEPAQAAALGFAAAVLWQVAPVKRRAVLACHRTLPIAPAGWRADLDCLRYGWMVGSSCLVSCWALMLACLLSGHSIPAMACATAVGWTERNRARPNQRLLCAVIAILALAYAIVPFVRLSSSRF
jgi:predicted metal-binding membrane protein